MANRKKHSDEARAKMSASQRGRVISPEHRKKLSEAALRRAPYPPVSAATRAKISAAKKGKRLSADHVQSLKQGRRKMGAALWAVCVWLCAPLPDPLRGRWYACSNCSRTDWVEG